MRISVARKADAVELLELQRLAFSRFPYFLEPQVQSLDSMEDEIKRKVFLKGVHADGAIIASVRGYIRQKIGHIERLIVHPSYQRLGYGTKLMSAIEAKLSAAHIYQLYTASDNIESICLYKKIGYSEMSRVPTRNSNELVYMVKQNREHVGAVGLRQHLNTDPHQWSIIYDE